MQIAPFELERYFGRYEFSARYLLSSSDCEALSLAELLATADDQMAGMWRELRLGYTESWGHPLLREEIAGLYNGLAAENVLTVVPEEGIFLLMHTLVRPGDHVVCTMPGYQSLYEIARSTGAEVDGWLPYEEQGWRFDPDDLARLLRPDTRLVVINFPHNPTGWLSDPAEYRAIVEPVRRSGAHLLSDEMYRYLELDGTEPRPAACTLYDRAVSLSGLSKSFGLPGLRTGWLATRNLELLEQISRLKDYTTICAGAPTELLSIIALRGRETILATQQDRVSRNLAHLDAFMTRFSDRFNWQRPRAGSICFPRLAGIDSSYAFCQMLLAETGIMLAPSPAFLYGDQHVRIGYGREDLPQVLALFGDYLDAAGT
jgi:aspartate/methionine/tyrosine aminotransferase